jgi:hypothetical protein
VDGMNLPQLGSGIVTVVTLVSIGLGLLNCFLGYRIFRFMLGVYGFVLGAIAGLVIAGLVTDPEGWGLVLPAFIGGVVGAGLMVLLYLVGVFVVGAAAGVLLVSAVGAGLDVTMPPAVVIIVAVVLGIVALILQKVVIVVATALSGAWAAVMGAVSLIVGREVSLMDLFVRPAAWQRAGLPLLAILLVWLVLAIAGAVVQFSTTKEKPVPSSP